MIANGYPPEFAERTFKQLDGFGSYGFPESRAVSFRADRLRLFMDEVPPSPDVFLAAILNRAADGVLCASPTGA